jgi:hypothetical protein
MKNFAIGRENLEKEGMVSEKVRQAMRMRFNRLTVTGNKLAPSVSRGGMKRNSNIRSV